VKRNKEMKKEEKYRNENEKENRKVLKIQLYDMIEFRK
jgi:hypothetical protein